MEEAKDPLALPSPEVLREIAAKQEAKAHELAQKRKQQHSPDEQKNAAQVIQRNYRGYRARRELQGYALDPSLRWVEALREGKCLTE
jgi:hypothetical protein